MTITPQGNVYLCKTKLEKDYKNQLTFANVSAQQTYFNSTIAHTFSDYTYIKKDGVINVGANYDDICDCDYLFYRNVGFTTKYYYCFIKDMEYVNENCTKIYFETDCYQTWLFDINYSKCFVEREHVNDDTIGLHTIPENLELGEYISNGYERDNELSTLCYVIQVSEWVNDVNNPLATNYGGIYSAGGAYICDTIVEVVNIVQAYQSGREDAILNVYVVPKKIVNNTNTSLQYSGQNSPVTWTKSFAKPTTLNGYTPTNKKLLTYPYCYLILDNNCGQSNILQYENFSTNNCTFEMAGVPTVGGSIKCAPTNYKGEDRYQQEGVMCGKFPTCSWAGDPYTNWLTQNSVNIGLGVASAGLTIVGGVAMMATGVGVGAGAGAIVAGGFSIAQTLGQVYQHSLIPKSAEGNINGGDINTCYDMNKFYFIKMSIREEYAKVIDDYFSMYGYKVNSLKVPNITGRTNWNYVKTINCNFTGNIPQTDLEIIKAMFNNGVTLWHNPSTMLNYNNSNTIVA